MQVDTVHSVELAGIGRRQREQAAYFDKKYATLSSTVEFDHYEKPRFGPWNPYWFVYNFVKEQAAPAGKQLLSLGCGTGADALRYARLGYRVEGIDVSGRAIELARSAARKYELQEQVRFEQMPAERLAFPDETFDLVVGVDVLHHIDVAAAAREISRVLKSGGVAIFREPLATPRRDRIRRSRPVTWLLPLGVKCKRTGQIHGDSEGEHKLGPADFDLLRRHIGELTIYRWRVLAVLNAFMRNKDRLLRWDWRLFRMLPFLRRFGDQAVLMARKDSPRTRLAPQHSLKA